MPTYQYACSKCGDDFEVYQSFSDTPLKKHPGCGGSVQKVFAPVGIVLKGSGFYKTDNRANGGRKGKSDSGSEKSEKSETKADSGSKSEAKSESSSGNGAKKDASKSTGSSTAKAAK